ncbi:hypothetical protein SFRURICE_012516, partial [Spodoptera frugiperda]
PPRSNLEDLNKFFANFSTLLRRFCYRKKRITICGDFNINTLNASSDANEFKQIIHSYNLKLSINEPTRLSSRTCIDNIMFNIRGCTAKVIEFALSDHTAQLLKCPVKPTFILKSWYVQKRDYSSDNIKKFKECLVSLKFNDVYSHSDPNLAFNEFHELFTLFYNLCFPIVNIKITNRERPQWVTKGLKICCKRKRQLLWQYRKKPTEENKNKFLSLSARLNQIIRLTQKTRNDYYINNAINKSQATWKIINANKSNVPTNQIQQIVVNGNMISDPEQIADHFNKFYIDHTNNVLHNRTKCDIPYENNSMFVRLNIDNALNYKQHLETLCTKLNTYSYALFMLRRTVSISALLTAYHGHVASLLRYCVIFWGNSTDNENVFRAQKKCVRAIAKITQTDSCKPFFIKYSILTLPCIYLLEVVMFVRKNMHYFSKLKSKRHNCYISIPQNKTARLNKSIFCMAPRIYNHLPRSVLETPQINMFKRKVKTFVLKSYVITRYALDNTLHAICYHHVDNQRGSLVKQYCLSTHDFACSFRWQY